MSLLLCAECYTWVEPSGSSCPNCYEIIDKTAPDPELHILQSVIGEIVTRLGGVTIRRRQLPGRGTLYATTNGLYFLPHQELRLWDERKPAFAAAPLFRSFDMLLRWVPSFGRGMPTFGTARNLIYQPLLLGETDGHRLPQLLMENPGAFFVPQRAIRLIRRRRNAWLVDRYAGCRLKFKAESDVEQFHGRMSDLIASHFQPSR